MKETTINGIDIWFQYVPDLHKYIILIDGEFHFIDDPPTTDQDIETDLIKLKYMRLNILVDRFLQSLS